MSIFFQNSRFRQIPGFPKPPPACARDTDPRAFVMSQSISYSCALFHLSWLIPHLVVRRYSSVRHHIQNCSRIQSAIQLFLRELIGQNIKLTTHLIQNRDMELYVS